MGTISVLALDPGPSKTAWVLYKADRSCNGYIAACGWDENLFVRKQLQHTEADVYACEMVSCMGMPVGREVFETVLWVGRYMEVLQSRNRELVLLNRQQVKMQLCGNVRARDANIRCALLDRHGGRQARGTKKEPGPLYGVTGHIWSALAVAVAYVELKQAEASTCPA